MLTGPLTDVVVAEHAAATLDRAPVELSVKEVRRLLGTTLAPEGIGAGLIEQYLTALGCVLEAGDDEVFSVTLPSWRLDLARPVDLIEEIARVYGYNGFANTLPTPGTVQAHPTDRPADAIRARLLALGYTEALSSSFASAADGAFYAGNVRAVALENPLSEELSHLRPSLVPGMVAMLAQNLTRDVLSARLFEMGACFAGSGEGVEETPSLALGLTGEVAAESPVHLAADAPFYELKGALESVFSLFDVAAPVVTAQGLPPMWEAGRAAGFVLEGEPIAYFGQLSSAEASRRKLRQPLYLAELRLPALLKHSLRRHTARELSRFQAVDRDFSFIFPDAVRWADIEGAIRGLEIAELQRLGPVEVFRDAKKFPGVHSTLTRVTFQATDRTLTDEELTAWWAAIIAALQALGGTLRDS